LEGRFRKTKISIFNKIKYIFADFEVIKGLHLFIIKHLNFTIIKIFYDFVFFFKQIFIFAAINNILNFNKYLGVSFLNDKIVVLNYIGSFVIYHIVFFVKLIFTKKLINTLLEKNIFNYYQSDLYSRNSKILSITALKTFNKNFASAVID